ncbi:MAG: hypothetical protein ACOCY0_02725 [Roseicyclus sp.]
MNGSDLHVFAVNGASELRHTHLTRIEGVVPKLPPLAEWLGVGRVDTDRIEIFPVSDLDGLTLADYVTMAFEPAEPVDADTRARLNALQGSVLIVPDAALDAAPAPGPALTPLATLALARPDHRADLPKARTAPPPPAETEAEPAPGQPKRKISQSVKFAIFIVIFILLYILLSD